MERNDPTEHDRPDEQPTRDQGDESTEHDDTQPTIESPAPEPAPHAAPRKLFRSRTDRVLGGVCGGLGRYAGVDPIVLRIVFVVLLFFGGVSLIAYLAALLFVPTEPLPATPGAPGASITEPAGTASPPRDRGRTLAIIGIAVLLLIGWPVLLGGGLAIGAIGLPLVVLALIGLLVWWIVSGEAPEGGAGEVARRSALGVLIVLACLAVFIAGVWAAGVGGGVVAAIIVIAAGVALVVGAFLGRLRILILPALALALGVGVVSAAGVDLGGGVGQRTYTPVSATDLRDEYELGAGELVVDLRGTDLPPGDTPLGMSVGMGEAALIVPRDVCVATSATVGAGNVASFGRDNGGVDLDFEESSTAPRETTRLLVDADVGFGEFRVQHEPYRGPGSESDGPSPDGGPPFLRGGDSADGGGGGGTPDGNAACAAPSTATEADG